MSERAYIRRPPGEKPRTVEFLIAWEDRTWTTEVIEGVVGEAAEWAENNNRFEGAVLLAPYCDPYVDPQRMETEKAARFGALEGI